MTTGRSGDGSWRWCRAARAGCAAVAVLGIGVCAQARELAPARVEIARTQFHIPHIKADDFRSLGYGIGYAYAEDNLCLLARAVLKVRGEQSRYFGAAEPERSDASSRGPTNLESDIFYRTYLDPGVVAEHFENISPNAHDLLAGYAAGYNEYLRRLPPQERPSDCRDTFEPSPISQDDLYRLIADRMIAGSVRGLIREMVQAHPPSDLEHEDTSKPPVPAAPAPAHGSNAYALGRDLTATGHGMLLANPHFPWQGDDRFYEMHISIPGQLDAMGAALLPFPVVIIGFNKDVAWTHTVSTGRRQTLYDLRLTPGDPTRYVFDGGPLPLVRKQVAVRVRKADGTLTDVEGGIYTSRFGPVVTAPYADAPWSRSHAFAVRDALLPDGRAVDQWLKIDQATSVEGVRQALAVHGTPWVNTIAADRAGATLYADASIVPNVTERALRECAPGPEGRSVAAKTGLIVLDGSRSDCDWVDDQDAAQSGVIPSRAMPSIVRTDYVLNSNDSFWLANREQPLTGFSSLIGKVGNPQNLRTRMGYKRLDELIAAKRGRITADDLRSLITDDRDLAAEMILDDVLAVCRDGDVVKLENGSDVVVAQACAILAQWNRRDEANSRGAAIFRQIWQRMRELDHLWKNPFDASAPTSTPNTLETAGPDRRRKIRQSIAETVQHFWNRHIELDIPLGATQMRATPSGRIPLDGGYGTEGVLNNILVGEPGGDASSGGPIVGSSYMQVVTWPADIPVCRALLAYGQSSDPASPYYSDQTNLFTIGYWPKLPFTEADVQANAVSRKRLDEPSAPQK